jgi:mannose-6-phosphate isomerase-like protein (cupin superfamily)
MYDKSDPRSALSTAKSDPSGSTVTPASYGLYYQEPPVDENGSGCSWYTRAQNLLVNYIESKPGDTFARSGQVDEYMIVLPDEDTPWEATAKGESMRGNGYQLIIVPPGESSITLPQGGRVVRLFSTQSADLNAKCANAATYVRPDASHPPFKAWPAPPAGYKLRVYDLVKERKPGQMGPIWRCTTIMLNFPPPGGGPRDVTKMSPHSHSDFDQCSLILAGSFIHHMRWPWGLNKNEWHEDEHPLVGAPSATMIPARVIHTSEALKPGPEGNRMADIFSPPRLDFSLQPGWVKNADEYPMPAAEDNAAA